MKKKPKKKDKKLIGVYLAKDGESEVRLPLKERPNCVLLKIEKVKS